MIDALSLLLASLAGVLLVLTGIAGIVAQGLDEHAAEDAGVLRGKAPRRTVPPPLVVLPAASPAGCAAAAARGRALVRAPVDVAIRAAA